MTLSADNRKPENHTPHNYWSDTNGFPAPTRLFGKYIGFGEPTPHPKIDAKKLEGMVHRFLTPIYNC